MAPRVVLRLLGRGVIVATGSISGTRYAGVAYIAYSSAKVAVSQTMQSAALQHAYGGGDARKMVEARNRQCPTGEMGDAWDTAHAVLFLASDEAKYITGTTLAVDSGLNAKYA